MQDRSQNGHSPRGSRQFAQSLLEPSPLHTSPLFDIATLSDLRMQQPTCEGEIPISIDFSVSLPFCGLDIGWVRTLSMEAHRIYLFVTNST